MSLGDLVRETALFVGYTIIGGVPLFIAAFVLQYFLALIGTFISWCRTGHWKWPELF
jgi:hypothetical protein